MNKIDNNLSFIIILSSYLFYIKNYILVSSFKIIDIYLYYKLIIFKICNNFFLTIIKLITLIFL